MFRFLTILLISILYGVEVDIFIPSFPELQRVFDLSPFKVQMLLSVNFIAYCVATLWAGPMGDRFNRRHVILAGLGIFVLGSSLCVFANTFWLLLMGRFLQGFGIAAPSILAFVVIADEYPLEKQSGLMGLLNGGTAVAMACAPVVGSFINLYFDWRANFVSLLGLGIVTFAASFITLPHREGSPSVSLSLKGYAPLLRSIPLWQHILVVSLIGTSYWGFIAMAPILYMNDLGVPLKHFGFYQGSLAFIFGTISLCCPKILAHFGEKRCLEFGKWGCLMSGCMTLVLAIAQCRSPIIITTVLWVFSIAAVFPINILYPRTLGLIENTKGRSAALAMTTRLVLTAIMVEGVSYFYHGTFTLIGLAMATFILLSVLLMNALSRNAQPTKTLEAST